MAYFDLKIFCYMYHDKIKPSSDNTAVTKTFDQSCGGQYSQLVAHSVQLSRG